MAIVKKLLALVFSAGALYFLTRVLFFQWSEIKEYLNYAALLWFVVAAIPIYVATAISNATAWIYGYRSTGEPLDYLPGLKIHLVSQIGKYFPGNVGHFVGRLGLLKSRGASIAMGGVSIVLEMIWLIAAAAALSVYGATYGALTIIPDLRQGTEWLSIIVLAAALFAPNAMIYLFNKLPRELRTRFGIAGVIRRPSEHVVIGCFVLYCANFLLNGLVLIAGFYWLFGLPPEQPLLIISLYSVAWLLGFILPGAPGGIGVREALLLLLLGGMYGEPETAAMAVVMRLVSVLGDLAAFGVGVVLPRRRITKDLAGG